MGRHSDDDSESDRSRHHRKEDKVKEKKHKDKKEKAKRRSPSPVGKSRPNKLQDATAEIEAALVASSAPPLPVGIPAVTLEPPTPQMVPQLIPPGQSGPELPVEKLRIYVGNINYAANENDVRAAFSRFGVIRSISMRVDPDKGHHRGFAFVEFMDPQSVEMVYKVPARGICFGGMPVRIDKPTIAGSGPVAPSASSASNTATTLINFQPIDIPVGQAATLASAPRTGLAQQIAASRGLGVAAGGFISSVGGRTDATPIFIENLVGSANEVDETLIEEVRGECARFGPVLALEFYQSETSSAPTAAVEFATADAARACTTKMNGRVFDKRVLRSGILSREFFDRIKQ